jgi:hypothetical protein
VPGYFIAMRTARVYDDPDPGDEFAQRCRAELADPAVAPALDELQAR